MSTQGAASKTSETDGPVTSPTTSPTTPKHTPPVTSPALPSLNQALPGDAEEEQPEMNPQATHMPPPSVRPQSSDLSKGLQQEGDAERRRGGVTVRQMRSDGILEESTSSTSQSPSPSQDSLPVWARSARQSPVNLRVVSLSNGSAPGHPEKALEKLGQEPSSGSPSKSTRSSVQAGLDTDAQEPVRRPRKRHMARRSFPLDPSRRIMPPPGSGTS